ncbi:MAG: ATP phosphoribosyltransferase regulatory subunit [Coriobacteriia bacterium]|nr:ATP phosphoribosyltransferase regulatory subunit [Coriobacteriia bacterium]
MQPMTPRGFRDVLYAQAREREAVASAMSAVFASWGYEPVETPVVEQYRTLEAGVGGDLERTAFRLFDLDGSLLALRPEMTVPIARVVASRLDDSAGPERIRYVADVFREHESLRGQSRQFRQVGIELVGAAGAAADAEVVLLLVRALQAAGLTAFTVGMGTAEVLRGILDRAGGPTEWRDAVVAAAQGRNLVEIDRLAARSDLSPEIAEALRAVPRIRGGAEALEQVARYAASCGVAEALASFAETWRVLDGLGLAPHLLLDFGIMRSFGYYTGLQLEAYAPGLGLPLAGGGRYDGLLSAFGRPRPAAGFALGLERVMIACAEQGRTPVLEPLDAVVGGEDAVAVFAAAERLADAGWRVRVSPGSDGATLAAEAEVAGAAALAADGSSIVRLDVAGEPVGALGADIPVPPDAGLPSDAPESGESR